MKKKIISMLILSNIILNCSAFSITTKADVNSARNEYEQLSKKVEQLEHEVQKYDDKISNLTVQINQNEAKEKDLINKIKATTQNIKDTEKETNEKEEILGDRLRALYENGKGSNYISVIFGSQSLGDLIRNISSVKQIISIDKGLIKELADKKEALSEQREDLRNQHAKIADINNEIKTQKEQTEAAKKDEQKLVDQANKQKAEYDKKFLAVEERNLVKSLEDVVNSSNSSSFSIQSALAQLQVLYDSQLKSPTVKNEVKSAIDKGHANYNIAKNRENNKSVSRSAINNDEAYKIIASGNGSQVIQAVLKEAYKHLGTDYIWGAAGPTNFDCSGLTSYCYRVAAGIDIGRTTYDQINSGVEVSADELQPGDLVFPEIGHVMMYIGNGYVIQAPHTGDVVKISPVGTVWRARRIIG